MTTDSQHFLRNLWRWKCGLPEEDIAATEPLNYDDLRRTEWSDEFEQLMRNRLVMGAMRYGRINQPGKPKYDRSASAIKRMQHYISTGNKEHLVDVANLCLLEFVECHNPNAHFCSVDDGDHTERTK